MSKSDLIPLNERTKEEQKVIATMGGKASGKARREKKLMKDQLSTLLSLPLKNQKVKDGLKKLGLKADDIDNQMALVFALYQRGLKGDTKAFELIRDTIGEKPADTVNNINVNYEDTLKKAMDDSEF